MIIEHSPEDHASHPSSFRTPASSYMYAPSQLAWSTALHYHAAHSHYLSNPITIQETRPSFSPKDKPRFLSYSLCPSLDSRKLRCRNDMCTCRYARCRTRLKQKSQKTKTQNAGRGKSRHMIRNSSVRRDGRLSHYAVPQSSACWEGGQPGE